MEGYAAFLHLELLGEKGLPLHVEALDELSKLYEKTGKIEKYKHGFHECFTDEILLC